MEVARVVGVSRRYAVHLALLSLLIAVPTLVHWSGRYEARDCRQPEALYPASSRMAPMRGELGKVGEHADRGRAAGRDRVDGFEVEYVVNRSFHPRRVYHKPARGLVTGGQSLVTEVELADDGGEGLPIHWVHIEKTVGSNQRIPVAGYVLMYDGRPVRDPIRAQLLSAPKQTVLGRLPMTIYLAWARVVPSRADEARRAVESWLLESARTYHAACDPG